ncbi:ribokinase [Roseibacterium sp. SDUM158016]|uniref:ribokinase n=1 Tax=Roseicyclus sediminis TaxID=2980997 RepID=UPI0021D0E69A|nr:ribokinase [Roseibacterium sp. SDUM158016]MCU4653058.1 ribokinase [Roseibacterium sp. SDUM158016]
MAHDIVILGVFVADASFRADRMPRMGETILGHGFALGPGGKGSNQSVAAAMAGGDVGFVTKLGADTFAEMALATWENAGVTPLATRHPDSFTGAAFIYIDAASGDNAIIISPGVAATISAADVEARAAAIGAAKVFVTQLEQPQEAAMRALALARGGGAATILNPAPAAAIPDEMLALCDYATPNETEAAELTGIAVTDAASAREAAAALLERGVGKAVIVTLGEQGCLWFDGVRALHVPAMNAGPVVETTGAGDAFNGAFAVALAEGMAPEPALRFANAAAAISVTRAGTAPSMPSRAEIEALLARG